MLLTLVRGCKYRHLFALLLLVAEGHVVVCSLHPRDLPHIASCILNKNPPISSCCISSSVSSSCGCQQCTYQVLTVPCQKGQGIICAHRSGSSAHTAKIICAHRSGSSAHTNLDHLRTQGTSGGVGWGGANDVHFD